MYSKLSVTVCVFLPSNMLYPDTTLPKNSVFGKHIIVPLRACLQGGRVILASGLTLAGGQKIARVYMQNFTGTLQHGTT